MKAGRVTIAGMLILIAFMALGAAALKNPTVLWTQFMLTAALTSLLFAMLAAIVGRGDRSFAIGFAVVGWSYILLSLGPWFDQQVSPWLLSSRIADELYAQLFQDDRNVRPSVAPEEREPWDMRVAEKWQLWRFARFLRIAHALSTIGHGVAGGCLAMYLRRRPPNQRSEGTT
jgi:MFS family permease